MSPEMDRRRTRKAPANLGWSAYSANGDISPLRQNFTRKIRTHSLEGGAGDESPYAIPRQQSIMLITHVVGARPNFMKVAPVMEALRSVPALEQSLVHTGQHYDENMSKVFFVQLGLPAPEVNLGVGSGSHASQVAQVMLRLEELVLARRPDLLMVYGDVNSTVAAALVCAKLGIKVAHVEAGLRARDRSMPEEVNRVLTDQLADMLFTPSVDGNENLAREGIPSDRIYLVGNVMIDTLVRLLPTAEGQWAEVSRRLGVGDEPYVLATLHRPSNVDDPLTLTRILDALISLSARLSIVFPVHPRTRSRLTIMGRASSAGRIHLADPLGYLEFLALQSHARVVLTDSGGNSRGDHIPWGAVRYGAKEHRAPGHCVRGH